MKPVFGVGLEILAVIEWVECCHISGPPYANPQLADGVNTPGA